MFYEQDMGEEETKATKRRKVESQNLDPGAILLIQVDFVWGSEIGQEHWSHAAETHGL
jgi:hypothetical protein